MKNIKRRIQNIEKAIGWSKIEEKDCLHLIYIPPGMSEEDKNKRIDEIKQVLFEKYGADADLSKVIFLISHMPKPKRPNF